MRIIPAHAGNSPISSRSRMPGTDHPRACGELLPRHDDVAQVERIIPAHAGNSGSGGDPAWQFPDHPRACGELGFVIEAGQVASGSSPRMRGTPDGRVHRHHLHRIIPAHAGNSRHVPRTTF